MNCFMTFISKQQNFTHAHTCVWWWNPQKHFKNSLPLHTPLRACVQQAHHNVSRWMTWLPISLKNAVKCDKWYQLQNLSITESLNAKGAREKFLADQPRACRSQCRSKTTKETTYFHEVSQPNCETHTRCAFLHACFAGFVCCVFVRKGKTKQTSKQ